MKRKVRKLIVPVAGRGTRLLPLTRRTPKALIQVGGRPMLDYVFEEARDAGLRHVILVMNPRDRGKFREYLAAARKRFNPLRFHVRFQKNLWGNGHAILQAADLIAGEPFAVRFPDDLFFHKESVLKTLLALFYEQKNSVILLLRIPRDAVRRYGMVRVEKRLRPSLFKVSRFVEKPEQGSSEWRPLASLASMGAYVFTPSVLANLRRAAEISPQLPDALPWAAATHWEFKHSAITGWEFPGVRLDCGTLQGLAVAEEFLRKRSP